jgi:nucleoside-diphosphate-sugar epimerase
MKGTVSIIGCGNIGLPLARLLLQDGYLVKGSTTQKSRMKTLRQIGVQPFLVNLNDEPDRLLADLIHADVVVITFPPTYTHQSSKPYVNQLQFLSQHLQHTGIEKVIFTSSTDVYPQHGTLVSEQDAAIIKPRFTETPVLTLERIFSEQTDFKTTILRFAGLMGPSYNSSFHLAGREIKGANDLINMVHQDDCIAVMHKIIKHDIWGETYNVVADQHPTKRDYYNQLCDLQGLARPNYIKGQTAYRIVSNDKLKHALGYQFLYPDPLLI